MLLVSQLLCPSELLSSSVRRMLTRNVKDKVDALLADDEIGPLAKVQKLRATLLDAGVAYTTTRPCTNFIVHPQNRGTTGVQPYNMHRKGAAILRAGADMSLLTNSFAMEVSSHAAKRAEQMSFNEKLVSSANGLMSPVSGTERFMTLSSSHTCQFIKSLIAGCKTNQKEVGDSTGHLSLHMWRHDSQLQTMAQQGWEWVVLPSYLEDAYPMLAALIQSSLNLANEVFECQSELELACSVAEAATFKIQNSVPFNWEDVAVATCNGGQIKSYAKHIGRFVKLYSGWACILICTT